MKAFNIVMKVVVALTAVAGAVYLAATYGDKLVAWAKKTLGSCKCCCSCTEEDTEAVEEAVEEVPAEEAAEETAEAPVEETDVVAAETDFEG